MKLPIDAEIGLCEPVPVMAGISATSPASAGDNTPSPFLVFRAIFRHPSTCTAKSEPISMKAVYLPFQATRQPSRPGDDCNSVPSWIEELNPLSRTGTAEKDAD